MKHKSLILLLVFSMLLPMLIMFSENVEAETIVFQESWESPSNNVNWTGGYNSGVSTLQKKTGSQSFALNESAGGIQTNIHSAAISYPFQVSIYFYISSISDNIFNYLFDFSPSYSPVLTLHNYGGVNYLTQRAYNSSWIDTAICTVSSSTWHYLYVNATSVTNYTIYLNDVKQGGVWGTNSSQSSTINSIVQYVSGNQLVFVDDFLITTGRSDPVPPPPVAAFSASAISGNPGANITFTDSSTNGPTNWSWGFGDGNTSWTQSPYHIYALPGSYNVSLLASNSGGGDYENKTNYITITGWGPTFTNSPGTTGRDWAPYAYTPAVNETSTLNLVTKPAWATFEDGVILGIPAAPNASYTFELKATSTNGTLDTWINWSIHTQMDWYATVISHPGTSCNLNVSYLFILTTNESATVTGLELPAWLTLEGNGTSNTSWNVSGIPQPIGAYNVSIQIQSDAGYWISYENWTITVGAWAVAFTSTPNNSSNINTVYNYSITLNQTGFVTADYLPIWLNLTGNGTDGPWYLVGTSAPIGIYYVNLSAYWEPSLITYQNFSINVAGWMSSYWGSSSYHQQNDTTLWEELGINETAVVTANSLPIWLNMTNNGSSGSHILFGQTTTGTYSINLTITSVNGTLSFNQNLTAIIWMPDVPAPMTNEQILMLIVMLTMSIVFTILYYRDPRTGIIAGMLWFLTGLLTLVMLSPVLLLISIIPAAYYAIAGVSEW